MQTTLFDFWPGKVRFLYHLVKKAEDEMRGHSEKQVRKMLERRGWLVWLGSRLGREPENNYLNVRRHYSKLYFYLEKYFPESVEMLKYINRVHHGMPDFVCYKAGRFKFVECKLGYEPIREGQRKSIKLLQKMGFKVEVFKVVYNQTKTRKAIYDVDKNTKIIIEKQKALSASCPR